MSKVRIFSVQSVQLNVLKSNPPQLSVSATGFATTPLWSEPELRPLEDTLSPDGILDLEFVAVPPDQIVSQVLSPIAASTVWTNDVDRVIAVRIVSRTNDPITFLRRDEDGASTRAVGEEGPSATSPERMFTTFALGEETPTTLATGEEGHWPTTLAIGEETPTTFALGEEGPWPTTFAVGEEGAKTLAIGEEAGVPGMGGGKTVVGEVQDALAAMGLRNPFSQR